MYRVAWINICLLTRMEETFIRNQPNPQGPDERSDPYHFSYYGLGRKNTLRVGIETRENSHNHQIIVTTDLEVFQNPDYAHYFGDFTPTTPPWKTGDWLKQSHPIYAKHPKLSPFIVIPLIMVAKQGSPASRIRSFKELPGSGLRYGFGGLHNSAGESLLKTLKVLYGEDFTESFLTGATLGSMPAQAFQHMLSGKTDIAIVPTIFAIRQGSEPLMPIWPEEGAVAIPSYVAMHSSVPEAIRDQFFHTYLNAAFQSTLVQQGDILPTHAEVSPSGLALANDCKVCYAF